MKKHNLFLIAGLAAVSLFSACGSLNTKKDEVQKQAMNDDEDDDKFAQMQPESIDAEVVASASQEEVEQEIPMHVAHMDDVETENDDAQKA